MENRLFDILLIISICKDYINILPVTILFPGRIFF